MSVADVVFALIGTPNSDAGWLILYTICGILCMVVIQEFIAFLHFIGKWAAGRA